MEKGLCSSTVGLALWELVGDNQGLGIKSRDTDQHVDPVSLCRVQ